MAVVVVILAEVTLAEVTPPAATALLMVRIMMHDMTDIDTSD